MELVRTHSPRPSMEKEPLTKENTDFQCSIMWLFALIFACCTFHGDVYASDVDRQATMTTSSKEEEGGICVEVDDVCSEQPPYWLLGYSPSCELIMDLGYSCETSKTTTEDGFVIEVDRVGLRIAGNETTTTENGARRRPVLLITGILADSCAFFLSYPPQSAGYVVVDQGYDVWSMNTREDPRRSHSKYFSQDDNRYWWWSFDEIGRYDVAAVIDHILNATGSKKVSLLGYSQGFLSTVILLSTRPEYNEKVDLLIGYAPVTFVSNLRFPFPELIAIAGLLRVILDPDLNGGPFYFPEAPRRLLQGICKILNGEPCSTFLMLILFSSEEQLNKTRIPVALNHFPIATSIQNLLHYVQLYRSKRFSAFDYGPSKNKQLYGQEEPPSYPVERIRVPMALFSSEGDILADPTDLSAFIDSLSSPPLFNRVLPQRNFRHLDFEFGVKSYGYLHKPMVHTLDKYAGKSA